MKDIFNILGAFVIIIGLIGLFDVYLLPSIKANALYSEKMLSQQKDPYLQAFMQAEQESF